MAVQKLVISLLLPYRKSLPWCDSRTLTIYPMLARYAVADRDGRGELSPRILTRLESSIARDRTDGVAFELPYVDKAEFEVIRQRLMAPTA